MPHISIKAEPIAQIFSFQLTNSFLASLIVNLTLIIVARIYYYQLQKRERTGFYFLANMLLKYIYNLFFSVLKDKTPVFFPLLATFFFFIIFNNWFGLLPGVGSLLIIKQHEGSSEKIPLLRGATADLNTTLALAIISVFVTQYYGFRLLGPRYHLGKYFNFSSLISLFVGVLELIQEFARIVSFSFRLFGNIFAGEVLISIVAFLLPPVFSFFSFPMFGMEIFVGIIQALVFTMLTAVFINLATHKH